MICVIQYLWPITYGGISVIKQHVIIIINNVSKIINTTNNLVTFYNITKLNIKYDRHL